MRRYQFTVREHEEYGTLGYAPRWYPNGDPLGGMAVAHDTLSHDVELIEGTEPDESEEDEEEDAQL